MSRSGVILLSEAGKVQMLPRWLVSEAKGTPPPSASLPCVFSWISAAFLSSPVRPRRPIKPSQLLSGKTKCFHLSYRKMQITTTLEVQKECFVVGQDGFEVSASESRKGPLLLWFYYFILSGALSGHSML